MAVPWMRLLDTAIGIADIARSAAGGRGERAEPEADEKIEMAARAGGNLEARLA